MAPVRWTENENLLSNNLTDNRYCYTTAATTTTITTIIIIITAATTTNTTTATTNTRVYRKVPRLDL